jgi:hypothetical protein
LQKRQNPDAGSSSSDDGESDTGEKQEGADTPDSNESQGDESEAAAFLRASRKEMVEKARAKRKEKRKAEKEKTLRLAEERKSKEVKLNRLSSISQGGNSLAAVVDCYKCGMQGHRMAECPSREKKKRKASG